jgi:hypothetical protein
MHPEKDRLVIRLAGRLGKAQVPVLFDACASAAGPPMLELEDLISADAAGMDALLRIEEQGAELLGLPEHIRLTLDALSKNSTK